MCLFSRNMVSCLLLCEFLNVFCSFFLVCVFCVWDVVCRVCVFFVFVGFFRVLFPVSFFVTVPSLIETICEL